MKRINRFSMVDEEFPCASSCYSGPDGGSGACACVAKLLRLLRASFVVFRRPRYIRLSRIASNSTESQKNAHEDFPQNTEQCAAIL